MIIECDPCTVRGAGCGDCVIAPLFGVPEFGGLALDAAERRALTVLAEAGLIEPMPFTSLAERAS
jgi:hypothetical protein